MEFLVTVEGVGDRSVEARPSAVVADLVSALGLESSQSILVRRTGRVLGRSESLAATDLRSGDTIEPVAAGAVDQPRQQERPATLRILSGPEEGRTFDLDHGETTVGRVASNDIVLVDASLSRHHAYIHVDAEGASITDAGSTNGVLVDGKVISGPTRLGADQPVLVGQTWFVVDHHVGEGWPGTGPTVRFQPSPRASRQIRPQIINLPAPPSGSDGVQAVAEDASSNGGGQMASEHFEASLQAVTTRLDGHIDAERLTRLFEAPSVAELSRSIRSQTRLWERAAADPLTLRIGRTELPSSIDVVIPEGGTPEERGRLQEVRERYSVVPDGPATVDLDQLGNLEISGASDSTSATVGELLGQLAALHSPEHLAITAILTGPNERYDWMKWLPHSRLPALAPATSESEASALASGLLDRLALAQPPTKRVVVAVESGALPAADLTDLIERGPAGGVHVVALTESGAEPLPAAARLAIEPGERVANLHLRAGDQRRKVVLERSDGRLLRELARHLSPVVDARSAPGAEAQSGRPAVGGLEARAVGPQLSSFLGTAEHGLIGDVVQSRWQRASETLGAPIGQGPDGPVTIDVEQDTTVSIFAGGFGAPADDVGAAASLLETAVLSMAATYPPEALNFVLIDRTAGPTFRDCAGLPHTVAVVTDTGDAGVRRTLTSLQVEHQRRTAALSKTEDGNGAEPRMRRLGQGMPDLVIVIDELADAIEAVPDFITHLIELSHRGSDVGFRLFAASDRLDRLGPETLAKFTTRITLAGNPLLLRDGVPAVEFSTAVTGGEESAASDTLVVRTLMLGAGEVVGRSGPAGVVVAPMDASSMVDVVRDANDAREDVPELRKPILPPLPGMVDLRKLPKPTDDSQFVVGIVDLPERQRRIVMAFNAARDRSLAVVGPAGSGKSTALRSVAASVGLTQVDADRLPLIYALDFDGGGLAPIAALPHVAIVADDAEKSLTVLADLEHLFNGRRSSFGQVGAGSLAEYRTVQQDDLVRQVFVLIDDFGSFHRSIQGIEEGRWDNLVQQILMTGSEVGIQFVLTAKEQADIQPELLEQIGRWMTLVGTADGGGAPLGRALVSENEVQLAVLDGAADPASESEALARLTDELLARGATPSPAL